MCIKISSNKLFLLCAENLAGYWVIVTYYRIWLLLHRSGLLLQD